MENPQPLRESALLLGHSHFELLFSYTQLEYLWVQLLSFLSHPAVTISERGLVPSSL